MINDCVIRLSTPSDRDGVLAFIEQSGFNPRDAVTWDGLNMLAMTAWLGQKLIGAIPLEPRRLRVSAGRSIQTLHETTVAIAPEYRGAGLGSRMQEAIFNQRPLDVEVVTVFREDPQSPAYRWYIKNGFASAMNVNSWYCDLPNSAGQVPLLWMASDPLAPWSGFENAKPPGRVERDLRNWLPIHPYRNRYRFWIVTDESGAAALLGVGTMHSDTERVEILDCTATDAASFPRLIRAVCNAAAMNNWRPVRLPLAVKDPRTDVVRALGWQSRWSFDMLARVLSPVSKQSIVDSEDWRYAGIDYI